MKVIPIIPETKRPCFKGWQHLAKPLAEWHMPEWKHWAALCGPINMMWVLDIDNRESYARLPGRETIEDSNAVLTPRGGLHMRFLWGPECEHLTNGVGVLGPGLDTRVDGGYVVCPPTPGYKQIAYGALQPAPDWLMKLLAPKPRPTPPGCPKILHSKAYADAAVTAAIAAIRGAPEGTRNATLNRNAFGLGKILGACGLDFDKTLALLVDTAMESGISAYEALDTVSRGLLAGANHA